MDGFAASRDVYQHGLCVVFVEDLGNLLVSLTLDFSLDCGCLVRSGSNRGGGNTALKDSDTWKVGCLARRL